MSQFKPSAAAATATAAPAEELGGGQADRAELCGDSHRERIRRRIAIVAAIIIVVILIVVISVEYSNGGGDAAGSGTPQIRTPLTDPLPGTSVVADYSGRGAGTLHPERHELPSGHDLFLNLRCVGAGPVTVGPVQVGTCGSPVNQAVTGVKLDPLSVTAPNATKWRVVISDQPQLQTNGYIENPPDAALSDPHAAGMLASRSGSGPATITVDPPDGGTAPYAVRIALSCKGAGVSIGSNVTALDGKYTRSCYAGWSYDFDVPSTTLPATLTVTAAQTTSWRIVARTV